MNKNLKEKIKESLSSVLPITVIVLILSITVSPMPIGTLMLFMVGAALLIVGMGFFTLGADMAMLPFGEGAGEQITKIGKLGIILPVCFLIGFIITIAEPELSVLATQVPSIPNAVIIITVAAGVGIFLVMAMLRILFRVPLKFILLALYVFTFIFSIFIPKSFLAVAFDSGGVTTGPITVPFIMALGIGMSSVRSDRDSQDDSFGLVSICSIGPILAIMLLGIFYTPSGSSYSAISVPLVETTSDVAAAFTTGIPLYLKEVALALLPIMVMFAIFQLITGMFKKRPLKRVGVGVIYTYIGLVLFLTGVNIGFMPAGHYMGTIIGSLDYNWILIPLGMVIGYFIVKAEPAVHVLNKQVAEISNGAVSSKAMQRSLSIGVAISVGIAMLRVVTSISILWFLIPGYLIAIILSFIVPNIFVGIAFDSGGVTSGPMTAAFILPLAMGACEALGGNILLDAFGAVAMVAMTPLITVQIMGLASKRKMARIQLASNIPDDDIIDYEEVMVNV